MPTVTGSASSGRTAGIANTLTVSHTANGDDLFVWVGTYNGLPDWPTMTYNGVNLGRVLRDRLSTGGAGAFLFRMPAAPAGTANLVVTTVGSYYMTMGAFNVNGAGGVRAVNSTVVTTTTPSVTVPSVADDLVIDFLQSDAANQDWTAGAGQTLIYEIVDATANQKSAASWETAVAATTTMSHTLAINNSITMYVASLTPAASSGGGETSTPFVG